MNKISKKTSKLLEPNMKLYFLIMAVFAVLTIFSPSAGLGAAEAAAVVLLYVYFRRHMQKQQEEVCRYLDAMSDDVEKAGKVSMLTAPFPMMVFRVDTEEILWSNDGFLQATGIHEELFNNRLSNVLPGFSGRWLLEGKTECPETMEFNDRRFRVYGSLSHPGGKGSHSLLAMTYWVDTTELDTLRRKSEEDRPVTCILMVDNYEELMKAGTEASRSSLLAKIDEKLNAWIAGHEALLCRYDRNCYLLLITEKHYEELAKGKFSVMDDVRSLVTEDGVAATLSIGVGKDGESFEELFQSARISIEMALSRGGDQVVVKNHFDFEFYGGRTKSTEKRTKVKSRVMANALGELISDASQVFIMGHKHADMDAVGAAAGLCCIARKRGKKAQIVIDMEDNAAGAVLEKLAELPEYEDCFISGSDAFIKTQAGALLVVVDTNRPDFVESEQLLDTCNRVAVIDHHRRAASYIESAALNYHEPYASSASELVSELLQYLVDPGELMKAEAEALLAGIMLDTKNFTMRTGSRTFEAAALLRRAGADTSDVQRLFQSDLAGMLERYDIIKHAELIRDDIAIAAVDEEIDRVTAAKAADELLTLRGISASVVIFRSGEGVNLSARSLGEINVQLIMEKLGGGGNSSTAGGQIPGGTVDGTRKKLIAAIEEYFEE